VADGGSRRSTDPAVEVDGTEPVPRQLVVVPTTPGPLRPVDAGRRPDGDELDEIIDEMFGPSTDEGPGLFDLALIAIGIGLVAWSWISGGGGPWFVIGIVVLVLGIALPARSVVRVARARRMARTERRILRTGRALDTSDPAVGTLAGSYDALVHAAGLPGVSDGQAAIEAGHAAVMEVASLLQGRPPLTDDERAYIERRTQAVRDLAALLVRTSRAWQRARLRDDVDVTVDARRRAAAVAKAREELEATTGVGAVEEIERLRSRIAAEGPAGEDAGHGA
jgi:hypothetical protein